MNITQLRAAVRELVPNSISTCVRLQVWDYEHDQGNPAVSVGISALNGIKCEQVDARTAEDALALFKLKTLPAFGLAYSAPPLERLSELEPEGVS